MTAAVEFGFVAALEREVSSVVKGWARQEAVISGRRTSVYRHGAVALLCGGTGTARAAEAASALVEKYSPKVLISIGFAGSCQEEVRTGSLVVPSTVVESATGTEYACAFGHGVLATMDTVAGVARKREARVALKALAVEMEAAGVARIAAQHGCEFAAIKAISDGAAEEMGFLSDFVTPDGFETGRFIAHIALRPRLWPAVGALQRNSKAATLALKAALLECIGSPREFAARHSMATARV